MQSLPLGRSSLQSSRLAYGCMRLADGERESGIAALNAAVEAGYTLFDHSDIYGAGACESLFGEWLAELPGLRDRLIIASKCGIRLDGLHYYDFSEQHIVSSVEGSLRRLGIEQLDLLFLHRPDYLMDIHEVAGAFQRLKNSGKVSEFGVSNFLPSRLDALQSVLAMPLQVNQVEINIHNLDAFENGTLDQCQQRRITPQAWCPLAGFLWDAWGNTFTAEQTQRVRGEVARQAKRYEADAPAVALAWLLRHPAAISPIVGSTNPSRIAAMPQALSIDYSREDWYRLLEARNGCEVP